MCVCWGCMWRASVESCAIINLNLNAKCPGKNGMHCTARQSEPRRKRNKEGMREREKRAKALREHFVSGLVTASW